jgi:hypothetical protein
VERVDDFVKAALEASVYVAPLDYGLTREELREIARQAGLHAGETDDAIDRVGRSMYLGQGRLLPETDAGWGLSADFNVDRNPDYRNSEAFDFVRVELQNVAKKMGVASARIARDVLVERGVAKAIDRNALQIAITVHVLARIFAEKDGTIAHAQNKESWILPSKQLAMRTGRFPLKERPLLAKVYPLVRDAIARRSDGWKCPDLVDSGFV